MDRDQIDALAERGTHSGKLLKASVVETHVSWVLLSQEFAYKIKKPVKLSFLDFSTLRKRKAMCEKELRLNRRFSPIYKAVLPVRKYRDQLAIGGQNDDIVDYAVVMTRLRSSKEMDRMLEAGRVGDDDIKRLAQVVADFHARTKIVRTGFNIRFEKALFNDIRTVQDFVRVNLGREYADSISGAIRWSDAFLKKYRTRFTERVRAGFKRDLHGDLHCGNVFLYRQPILFDCIEFNDRYRQRDVLDEVGFLMMDIEAFGRSRLAKIFLKHYATSMECFEHPGDEQLLRYYKCYRANVRAKVQALAAMGDPDQGLRKHRLRAAKTYLALMRRYVDEAGQ